MKLDEGGEERRVGWRWGVWGQRVVLPARDFLGSRRHLRSGILSFGRWRRLSLSPPEPALSSSLDGDGPKPSAASRPSVPSQGPSPSLPSPSALFGARRVLEGVRGHRVAEPGSAGSGQLAAGGAGSGGGGDSARAGRRLEGVAALLPLSGQQFSFLIPALTAELALKSLAWALKGYFLSGNNAAVHQRASPFLIFICLMLTASVLVLFLRVMAF